MKGLQRVKIFEVSNRQEYCGLHENWLIEDSDESSFFVVLCRNPNRIAPITILSYDKILFRYEEVL